MEQEIQVIKEELEKEIIVQQDSLGTIPTGTKQITENGTYNVYDFKYVEVNTPQPSGTINITQNGEHNVESYVIANINVPTGADLTEYYKNANTQFPCNYIKKIPYEINCSGQTNLSNMFNSGFTNLEEIKLINLDSVNTISFMFSSCTSLKFLDIRSLNLSACNTYNYFLGSSGSNRVPYNCLIIVKDTTQKSWMATKFSNYTNVKTVEEYESN